MDEHRERIKKRIADAILQFKEGSIDFHELTNVVAPNIKALDNVDKTLESAAIRLCGKLDIIHYTVDTDKEHEAMLEEVRMFETFLDKI